MFEQYITSAIHALIIYAVGFIVFLPFNFFMVRKNRDSTEAAMGDGMFQFTTKECVLISGLWPLCVIGLMWYSFVAILRLIGRIFTPRKNNNGKDQK